MRNKVLNSLRDDNRSKRIVYIVIGVVIGYFLEKILPFDCSSNSHLPADVLADGSQLQWNATLNLKSSNVRAERLYKEVRILCWVMTNPRNHQEKALHVKRTWGKRCNKLIFMSSEEDTELGSIALPVKEGRKHLWDKTREAFKYIYEHHLDDADWFFKADDDTYAVMENMRYLLYPYSAENALYLGCRFKFHVKQGYMSGGAGYVLSKEALRRLVEKALPNPKLCKQKYRGSEDVKIGRCLEKVHVKPIDTRDSQGRGRFFPFSPAIHLMRTNPNWYWNYIYYSSDEEHDCCSDYTISFHYIKPNDMYVMDYLIYNLNTFGISHAEEMPRKLVANIVN